MQIEEALQKFYVSMEGALSSKTIRFYRDRLKSLENFFPGRDVASITGDELNAWRAMLANKKELYKTGNHKKSKQGGYSAFTLHQYVRACRRFFKWLCEEGKIDCDPARRLRLPELPSRIVQGISDQARDCLLEASKSNPRDYAILMILADTGCRVGGLARLRMQDLDLKERSAIIHGKGRGGNQKERLVFFLPQTVQAIQAWLKMRPDSYGLDALFLGFQSNVGYHWHALTEDGIRSLLKRLARRAGVKARCNPHSFRHGAIRGMLARSMPLPAASQLAGHSSTQITGDIYGSYNPEDLRAMHDKSSWLIPKQ